MDIKQKRIVVTGAASGIGKELVKMLSTFECDILAVDRNQEALMDFQNSLVSTAANVKTYNSDISLAEPLDALFDYAVQSMGGIDIFVANAGYAYYEQLFKQIGRELKPSLISMSIHRFIQR